MSKKRTMNIARRKEAKKQALLDAAHCKAQAVSLSKLAMIAMELSEHHQELLLFKLKIWSHCLEGFTPHE